MNTPKRSLVLFQFDNMIITSAELLNIKKFNMPVKGNYYGVYKFDVNTDKTFLPIKAAE